MVSAATIVSAEGKILSFDIWNSWKLIILIYQLKLTYWSHKTKEIKKTWTFFFRGVEGSGGNQREGWAPFMGNQID